MARKSLSSQVLEELDRAGGLLRSVADSVDPIIGHLLGAVAESHRRIETMCLAAMQRDANAITDPSPLAIVFEGDKLSQARSRKPASTRRPTTHKRES